MPLWFFKANRCGSPDTMQSTDSYMAQAKTKSSSRSGLMAVESGMPGVRMAKARRKSRSGSAFSAALGYLRAMCRRVMTSLNSSSRCNDVTSLISSRRAASKMAAEYPDAITPLINTFVSRTTFRMAHSTSGFDSVSHHFVFTEMHVGFTYGSDSCLKLPRNSGTIKLFIQ